MTRRHDLIDAQWTAPAPLLPAGVAADRIGAVALAVPAGSAVPGQQFNFDNQTKTKANAAPAGPDRIPVPLTRQEHLDMTNRITDRISLGKILISASAVVSGVGPYVFDWNETHIYNPAWPPHAKFHNAQTMSMGAGLAGATLLQLWRPAQSTAATRAALDGAAMSAALYWVTQISALAYPGAKAVDPPDKAIFPQSVVALPALALAGLGYALERRRLRRQDARR